MAKAQVFGHIEGFPIGTVFKSYKELNSAGVHRSKMGGISGRSATGADSIVISGGYADDMDEGNTIIYTGHGGRNDSGKHVKDQELTLGNLALATSEMEGLPVRVIRGPHRENPFAPASGYRYDGLFRVDSHWHEIGKAGYKVWRYRLESIDAVSTIQTHQFLPLTGGNSSPARAKFTVQRIIRDTAQAKKVKQHYDFTCQVCGTSIVTAGGPYAEAAHIRPLGAPHNGPDTPSNILCLCPNHHVMFDMGAFSVNDDFSLIGAPGKLFVRKGHNVDSLNLQYHRAHYLEKAAIT